MLGLIGGTVTLHRVLQGRFSVWPVWSVLFIYNAVLFWGFLGCLFAIAVYLFTFSCWIATREWPTAPRILFFSAAGAVLFLLHLFAFGLYGLSVFTYEVGCRLKDPAGAAEEPRLRRGGLACSSFPGCCCGMPVSARWSPPTRRTVT